MSRFYQDMDAVTVGAGTAQPSNAVVIPANAEWLTVFSPATLDLGQSFIVQVSPTLTANNFVTVYRAAGVPLDVSIALTAVPLEAAGAQRLRVFGVGVMAAPRTFQVCARCA
jgi:hypothetical protein